VDEHERNIVRVKILRELYAPQNSPEVYWSELDSSRKL